MYEILSDRKHNPSKMIIVTTKKWDYQFRNETHVKNYSNGDDIEAEIHFGSDQDLAARFLEGKEKMVLSLVGGKEEMSPLFLVFKPMTGTATTEASAD